MDTQIDIQIDRQTNGQIQTDIRTERHTRPDKSIIFGITFNNSYYLSFSTRFLVDILTKIDR